MKSSFHPAIFIFGAFSAKEASTKESMGIGSQILSRLRSVRMSAREEESAENRIRHCSMSTRLLGDLREGWSRHNREIGESPWVEALGS
jgi:hypothetical protein